MLENAPNPHGTKIAGEYEPSGVLVAKEHKIARKLVVKHFVRSRRSPEQSQSFKARKKIRNAGIQPDLRRF